MMIRKIRYIFLPFSFLYINRHILWHLPRSFYYNLIFFNISTAIRCPLFIHNNVKIQRGENSQIFINCNKKSGLIKIGFNATNFYSSSFDKSVFTILGTWIINGKVDIGPKSRISIGSNAILVTHRLWVTGELLMIIRKKVYCAENVLMAWHITIMDHDAHRIFNIENERINPEKDIYLGENIWIGCNTTILKGTSLKRDIIIGAGSVVATKINEVGVVLAGNPARIIKKDVTWGGFY